ncbi:MAG TPA: SIMPL domain-containing protein [Thermomicrobiales bacterium]|nr:SIMPL domain-containing protein [Thermomicrobiales bacterium]
MKAPTTDTPLVRLEIGRRLALVGLTLAVVALSLAGWNHVAAGGQGAEPRASLGSADLAQLAPGSEPSLTVTGYGAATAPADSALIQLLIGPAQGDFGKGMYESSSGEVRVVTAGSEVEVHEDTAMLGTPVSHADGGMADPVDEAALEPLLAALEEAGIARDAIEVVVSPISAAPYEGPYSAAARLEFTIQQPELPAINELMSTLSQTAAEAGLSLIQAGASYQVEDCQSLEDEAMQAAIDDARQRAARLAEQLGVTTGETLLASDFAIFSGPSNVGGCAPFGTDEGHVSYGGPGGPFLSIPDYDPSAPPEVTVRRQLYLGLAIT